MLFVATDTELTGSGHLYWDPVEIDWPWVTWVEETLRQEKEIAAQRLVSPAMASIFAAVAAATVVAP